MLNVTRLNHAVLAVTRIGESVTVTAHPIYPTRKDPPNPHPQVSSVPYLPFPILMTFAKKSSLHSSSPVPRQLRVFTSEKTFGPVGSCSSAYPNLPSDMHYVP
jgi:hypothetical protein